MSYICHLQASHASENTVENHPSLPKQTGPESTPFSEVSESYSRDKKPCIVGSKEEIPDEIVLETVHSNTSTSEGQIASSTKSIKQWCGWIRTSTALSLILTIYPSKTPRSRLIYASMQDMQLNSFSISFSALLDIPCYICNVALCFFRRIHFTCFLALWWRPTGPGGI